MRKTKIATTIQVSVIFSLFCEDSCRACSKDDTQMMSPSLKGVKINWTDRACCMTKSNVEEFLQNVSHTSFTSGSWSPSETVQDVSEVSLEFRLLQQARASVSKMTAIAWWGSCFVSKLCGQTWRNAAHTSVTNPQPRILQFLAISSDTCLLDNGQLCG